MPKGRQSSVVVAPMLAGRFTLAAPDGPADRRPRVHPLLSNGRELRFRDDVQMGKVYLIPAGDWAVVPGLAVVGVDVLDPKVFTRSAFRELASKRRDQAKVFLMDKAALDALGNAYADEVLFEARIHPKAFVRSLSPEQVDGLHDAIVPCSRTREPRLQVGRSPSTRRCGTFSRCETGTERHARGAARRSARRACMAMTPSSARSASRTVVRAPS